MKKPAISILNVLLFLLIPFVSWSQTVKISSDCPTTIRAGADFLLTVRIEKGTLSSNGRLQLEVPQGFVARSVNSRGAEFEFANNIAKMYWNLLPEATDLTVTFGLKAPALIKGKQTFNGEFIYNNGDQTQHVVLQPIVLNVEGEPIAKAEIKNDPKAEANAEPKAPTPKVQRKIITVSEAKGEYRVELTFYPNNVLEAAQFTDILPPGYDALVIDAHESSYSFENQSVVFSWKKLPSEKSFVVSYMVRAANPGTAPAINGTLVYGEAVDGDAHPVGMVPASQPVATTDAINEAVMTDVAINEPSMNESRIESPATDPAETTPANSPANVATPSIENPNSSTDPSATAGNPQSENTDNTTAMAANTPTPTASASSSVTYPSNGITFRIQIAATQKSPNRTPNWFEAKYDIPNLVEMSLDNGWKKYIIGNFGDYATATEFRKQTQAKIPGAFVVAFQNGTRIPVSDAIRNNAINQ